uniref:Putative helicase senataxin n=1 Tax=Aceria tosichella TaxID=561515 RepID=A0A6G1SPJ2_9ACAR
MSTEVPEVVEAILTAILQWRVIWLDEQKKNAHPPPICRAESKRLKIVYDSYKDYEATFIPLLMHEIWAQIFDEWSRLEADIFGATPMDVDEPLAGAASSNSILTSQNVFAPKRSQSSAQQRRFNIGVMDIKREGQYQLTLRCQYIVESNRTASHMKIVSEGDLVRIDVVVALDQNQVREREQDFIVDVQKGTAIHGLFGYVNDVSSERITKYTQLATCFGQHPERFRNHHVVNYSVVIAKRPLRLRLDEPMRLSVIYYLKPMIRQIESVAMLKESALASDILNPKVITCQLTIPTVVSIKSPHFNDMQYKAIIGTNEALSRPYEIPKIQLIQGPPGTGKTHTLVGIIKHFYMNLNFSKSPMVPKILICAPSNGAVDEVAKRLMKEREVTKKGPMRRSLRLVRVGHPDQISLAVKSISLDELVESNVRAKTDDLKKKSSAEIKELEEELSRCDTEIANFRVLKRHSEIPDLEHKIARLSKELEAKKNSEDTSARREVSEASKRNLRYELVRNADVILSTLNSCQRHPLDSLFRRDQRTELSFHCAIVDEASQCVEPELLMPLCYKISKMILIGDPMQLPATVISRHAQDYDFGRSLFERFFIHFGKYDPKSPIAMLTDQYRMHPDICHFPSKQFYDGRLRTARIPLATYPLKPYILFEVRHGSQKSSSTSLENEVEAGLIRNILMAVLTKAPEKSTVGVITPYKSQKRLLTSRIASLQSQRQIRVDVNTCDGFQGQEKDIIILSCVRTFEYGNSIGFLKSFQRVNVALTRAKRCLIVCLSGKASSRDKTWAALVEDAVERRVIQTLLTTPTASALEKMMAADSGTKNNEPSVQQANSTKASEPSSHEYVPDYIMPMDID